MKTIKPASAVDAPSLSKDAAVSMPEFAEGKNARLAGQSMVDCPYSIFKQSEAQRRMIPSTEWRLMFENRMQAWLFGFNDEPTQ